MPVFDIAALAQVLPAPSVYSELAGDLSLADTSVVLAVSAGFKRVSPTASRTPTAPVLAVQAGALPVHLASPPPTAVIDACALLVLFATSTYISANILPIGAPAGMVQFTKEAPVQIMLLLKA